MQALNKAKINRDQPQMLTPALEVVSGCGGCGAVLGSTGIQMSGEIVTAEPQLSGGGVTPPMSRK